MEQVENVPDLLAGSIPEIRAIPNHRGRGAEKPPNLIKIPGNRYGYLHDAHGEIVTGGYWATHPYFWG